MFYSGVVFDFNGTLFWDTHLHNKAWNRFLKKYNLCFSDDEFFKLLHGRNNRDILIELFENKASDSDIEKFIDEKESLYRQLCLETDMKMADGVETFLDFLKNRDEFGYRRAIEQHFEVYKRFLNSRK